MIISAFENKKTCICKVLTEFEVLLTLDGISDTGGKYGGVDLYFNSSLDRYLLFSLKNIDVKYPTPQTNRAAACADNCAPDSFVANFEMYAFVARAGVDSALNCIITALTECCIKFGRITTDKYSVIEKILKSKKGVDISAAIVKKYGIFLRPSLYAHIQSFAVMEDALKAEKDLASKLKRQRYAVWVN